MSETEHDGNAVMAAFANAMDEQVSVMGPRDLIAAPVQMRPVGAQAVTVKRDIPAIFRNLRTFASAAGEAWYYSWDVKDKNSKRADGKTTIEGPSVKLANDLARLYGNCSNGIARVEDVSSHWIFHAQFIDFETGYEYTRPFQQRKSQGQGQGTQADRQADIAFQIGASKAIRNCVVNALGTFADFAKAEAKAAIVGRVEKDLQRYIVKVVNRLEELDVDLPRVERLVGKPHNEWTAKQVAKLIAEIQTIGEGIATPEEVWPVEGPNEPKPDKLQNFAKDTSNEAGSNDGSAGSSSEAGPGPSAGAAETPAAGAVVDKPAVPAKSTKKTPAASKDVPAKDAPAPAAAKDDAAKTVSQVTTGAAILAEAGKPAMGDFPGGGDLSGADKSPEQIERNRADTIAARPKVDGEGKPLVHDPQTGLVLPAEADSLDIPAFLQRAKPEARGISDNPEDRQAPDEEHVDMVPDRPAIADHLNMDVVAQWFPDKPPQWLQGYIARGQGVKEADNPLKNAAAKIANAWRAGWLTRDQEDDVMPI